MSNIFANPPWYTTGIGTANTTTQPYWTNQLGNQSITYAYPPYTAHVDLYREKFEALMMLLPEYNVLLLLTDKLIEHANDEDKQAFERIKEHIYNETRKIIDARLEPPK